jgi:hypothetical protein
LTAGASKIDSIMDAIFLLIIVAFFAVTWGFLLLCERV